MRVGPYRIRQRCALCTSTSLEIVLGLGHTPLANEFVKDPFSSAEQEVFPLRTALCETCGHLQMSTLVSGERLFRDYVYVTGTSPVTVKHFDEQAQAIYTKLGVQNPFVVDIGSNDGTALQSWKKLGAKVQGVDPARAVARSATENGIPTIPEFFTPSVARVLPQADVVIANNVFAHAENLDEIAQGVRMLIGSRGVFVCEVSYLGDILEKLAFDTIYHEHFSYHALRPLCRKFEDMGMKIFSAEWNPQQLGRGSLRFYAADATSPLAKDDGSVQRMVEEEERKGYFNKRTYAQLYDRIQGFGRALKESLDERLAQKMSIVGYGAPAKLTTLMYAFDMGAQYSSFIVEDSPWKQGLYTPGLHIPVLHPAELINRRPDTCVVWAWNFADSIIKKNVGFDGDFIVPLPELKTMNHRGNRTWV
jgi:hypothetical protein